MLKANLSPKSNQDFFWDWIWVKPLCKSIIATKEALLRFTVVSVLGTLISKLGARHAGIKNSWTRALRTLFVYTEFMKRKVFKLLRLAAEAPVRRCHGRQKVSIPECDLTGTLEEQFTITLPPVRSHSGIDTLHIANVSSSKLKNNQLIEGWSYNSTGGWWEPTLLQSNSTSGPLTSLTLVWNV